MPKFFRIPICFYLQNLDGSISPPLDVNNAKTKMISWVLVVTLPTIGNGWFGIFELKIVCKVLTMLGGSSATSAHWEILAKMSGVI